MRDRIPTKVLDNGAVRYAVYDEKGTLLRYEYMLPADEPTDPGTTLSKSTIMTDDVEALIWGTAADRTPNDAFGKVSEFYQHWWSAVNTAGTTTYICSPDRNAYPDSGTVDGLTYGYLGVPFDNARSGAKIGKMKYSGSGSAGSSLSSPARSLVFPVTPKLIFVKNRTTDDTRIFEPIIVTPDVTFYIDVDYTYSTSHARMQARFYSDNNTLKWYLYDSSHGADIDKAMSAMNASGTIYDVFYLY